MRRGSITTSDIRTSLDTYDSLFAFSNMDVAERGDALIRGLAPSLQQRFSLSRPHGFLWVYLYSLYASASAVMDYLEVCDPALV